MSNRQARRERVRSNKAERRRSLKFKLRNMPEWPRTWAILTNPHDTAIGMRYGHRHWSADGLKLD